MGKGLLWKMARTQAFFLPKSQNSQNTHTRGYKKPRGKKMSSRDEGGWVFIGEKKLRVPPTILESRIHSVLFERTSDTIYSTVQRVHRMYSH
jgi:phage pi2 protein 07